MLGVLLGLGVEEPRDVEEEGGDPLGQVFLRNLIGRERWDLVRLDLRLESGQGCLLGVTQAYGATHHLRVLLESRNGLWSLQSVDLTRDATIKSLLERTL